MEINTNNVVFGMKAISSIKDYARKNPNKRLKIDPQKIKKANESIKKALKGTQIERQKAKDSASKIILTV